MKLQFLLFSILIFLSSFEFVFAGKFKDTRRVDVCIKKGGTPELHPAGAYNPQMGERLVPICVFPTENERGQPSAIRIDSRSLIGYLDENKLYLAVENFIGNLKPIELGAAIQIDKPIHWHPASLFPETLQPTLFATGPYAYCSQLQGTTHRFRLESEYFSMCLFQDGSLLDTQTLYRGLNAKRNYPLTRLAKIQEPQRDPEISRDILAH